LSYSKEVRAIVITSINEPTKAVRKFAEIGGDYKVFVVGDQRTPEGWSVPGIRFLSRTQQEAMTRFRLVAHLPDNHYCRKMVGYLEAIADGAESILDTDDDNIPIQNCEFPEMDDFYETTNRNLGYVNMYHSFTGANIWPRGLPLNLILEDYRDLSTEKLEVNVGVFQGLANGAPDVDAIYRLTINRAVDFDDRPPIVLDQGTISPFNSQNTLFRRDCYPLLYLPMSVTFRYTDILRSIVAQPAMWAAGFRLGFTKATVFQDRNVHDNFQDFLSEIPMYETTRLATDLAIQSTSPSRSIRGNMREIYRRFATEGIVQDREIESLEAWLADLRELGIE